MSLSIAVRPALAQDKAAILSFCQNTFQWGDYIADVYDDWLADPNGELIVGLVDGHPVAILHVALLDDRVAWMEGMRVHPDLRRQGLAADIDIAGRNFARERGRSLARLATSAKNIPAQRTLRSQGYQYLTRTDTWVAAPSDSGDPHLPVATFADIDAIRGIWSKSPLRDSSAWLVPDPRWRWTELTAGRLQEHVRDNQVRVLPAGFSIVPTYNNPDGTNEYSVHALIGDSDTMSALALGARAEAGYRGFSRLEAMVPSDDQFAGILSSAGFVRDGAMLVYEINL